MVPFFLTQYVRRCFTAENGEIAQAGATRGLNGQAVAEHRLHEPIGQILTVETAYTKILQEDR